jgi:hypothetical protein
MTPSELDELKSRPGNSCAEVAERLGARLRRHGREKIGPCVICSTDLQSKTATRWQTKGEGWVCAACEDGGDSIWLVQKVLNLDFKAAVDWLGGIRDADQASQEADRKAKEAKKQAEAQRYRERERTALYDVWKRALDLPGTPVEAYLNNRGLVVPPWPEGAARLRYVADMAYFHGAETDAAGRRSPTVIHRGPAMVAAIARQGVFCGLHITYLTLHGHKLQIVDPQTDELLPAKKVRGSKAGGAIELIKVAPPIEPARIVLGEGVETVLSVWHAMTECGIDLTTTEFWSSVDLGNLGGRAVAQIVHPELKTAAGKPRRVPGPDPDLSQSAINLSDSVTRVTILGDSDSDPFTTRCAVFRGAQRFKAARAGRMVKIAYAPEGLDFNDMLVGRRRAGAVVRHPPVEERPPDGEQARQAREFLKGEPRQFITPQAVDAAPNVPGLV